MLTAKNLNKHFDGVYAVKDVAFKLEAGKITGIIGPNGSGKTTIVNLLSGMIPWDEGVVTIGDQTIGQVQVDEILSHGLTRTFQNILLVEQMNVWDNLALSLQQRGILSAFFRGLNSKSKKRAEEILKKLELCDKRTELAMNLSYGERKLLEIARVMALDTPVILLDEPFAGLSHEMVEKLSSIIQELKKQNKAIALIEHNMTLIRNLSDYVLFMNDGGLIAQGSPEKVFNLPIVLEAYLGKIHERPRT